LVDCTPIISDLLTATAVDGERMNAQRTGLALLFVAIAALLSSLAVAGAATAAWVNVDPAGVSNDPNSPSNNFGFNSVVVAPDGSVYVGTNRQGIYRSVDGGHTWSKVNTGAGGDLVDSGAQWTMAIDPFNPQVIYTTAARGEQGVLKTTDGGASWQNVFRYDNPVALQIGTNDVYSIAADPFTPDHVLASFHYYWNGSNHSGIIESTDGGATWIRHDPAGAWGAGNGVWFGNDSTTWILGSQSAGVWITSNSGTTWRQVSSTSITHGATHALHRDPSTGALFLADNTMVLQSSDNGATWQDITAGLPYAYFETILSDGTTLFTAPSFPLLGDNGSAHGPWYARPLAGTSNWAPYSTQTPCDPAGYCNGPVQGAYDPLNHILYSANWNGGLWKLQTGAPAPVTIPTPTATSVPPIPPTWTPTVAPTSTPTPAPTSTPTSTPTSACQVEALVDGAPRLFTRPAAFCTDQ
jgi:photosystem II stability/assembly factor-like uncharacterized protein